MIASIVGAGAAGLLHGLSFRARGLTIGHVFDPDESRARALSSLVGGRVHASLDSIADAEADIVTVCSPPPFHVDQAERCARADSSRVVFVEKPVGVSEAELARLERLPRCLPIVQWRAGHAIRSLRNAIAEGLLGESPSVAIDMTLHRGDAYFADGRRSRQAWGCGALLSVGIHALDAIGFLLDRPIARSWCAFDDVDAERSAVVAIAFRGGALATLRITFDASAADGDATRIVACGAGVSGIVVGTEADPTATDVDWSAGDNRTRDRLRRLDAVAGGHRGPPLLVPYLGEAVDALRAGYGPGEHDALVTMSAVAPAHRIAIAAYAASAVDGSRA